MRRLSWPIATGLLFALTCTTGRQLGAEPQPAPAANVAASNALVGLEAAVQKVLEAPGWTEMPKSIVAVGYTGPTAEMIEVRR